MTPGAALFAVCALLCLGGALVTIVSRSPVRSAIGLLTTIVGIAGLFLRLSAEFLSAIQLIVYAGAVVVLFVFVIMLLGSDIQPKGQAGGKITVSRFVAAALLLLAVVALMGLEMPSRVTPFAHVGPEHGSLEAIGTFLFGEAVSVFELTSALLIVAVVGAIGVARGKQGVKRPQKPLDNPQDLFAGPVLPRDAGLPSIRRAP